MNTRMKVLSSVSAVALGAFIANTAFPGWVDAIPVAGVPQYTEIIQTPCTQMKLPAGDAAVYYGEITEGAVDSGTTVPLIVGARYRVYTDNKAYINKLTPATFTPVACSSWDAGIVNDAAAVLCSTPDSGMVNTMTGLALNADSPEEISFSQKGDKPAVFAGTAASSAATVNLCRIQTTARP